MHKYILLDYVLLIVDCIIKQVVLRAMPWSEGLTLVDYFSFHQFFLKSGYVLIKK
jgi:hypothetical protein